MMLRHSQREYNVAAMSHAMKSALLLGVMLFAAALCLAQIGEPADPSKAPALDQTADQFIQRVHQSLDVGSAVDLFVPDFAALHREYPAELTSFNAPRMSKALLRETDDATIRRKLVADWNLHYWVSVLKLSNPGQPDIRKFLPAELQKAARKFRQLTAFDPTAGPSTLTTTAELTQYLTEADQCSLLLKSTLRPDMLTSEPFRTATEKARNDFGSPQKLRDFMGYDTAYAVARDVFMIVLVEKEGQYKLISLAPLTM